MWVLACLMASASGCLALQAYDGPGAQAGSPYTDEDAGTGYEVDLAGEDLASGVVAAGHYHPAGYNAPSIHGRDLKLQVQDCRTCHAQDLTGGSVGAGGGTIAPPSCDSCHQAGWRTTCTYCHGTSGGNGAPPRDLNGETDPRKISFPGHAAHTSGRLSAPFDCINCHRKPTDALTPYHIFDASPRRAENNLSGGLSTVGVYDPVLGKCTNLYCHGTGRGSSGTVDKLAIGPLACNACHADMVNTAQWATMSGNHRRHLGKGNIDCTHCHDSTVHGAASTLSNKLLHVDGKVEVAFNTNAGAITYNAANKTCNGSCHGEGHNNRGW